ncbi:hypothetical protein FOA52_001557 [Chlamydomonas sp. UWO 241]|nr:hypothetical protein FOA52_001557 [Chlamydomonas sp. UWO 241]
MVQGQGGVSPPPPSLPPAQLPAQLLQQSGAGEDAPPAEAWQVAAAEARSLHGASFSGRGDAAPPRLGGGVRWELQVLRSSQLDAQRLDSELMSMLHEQFMKVFAYFKPGQLANMEPELHAILLGLVFALSVWRGQSTPGSQLLNLRYRNEWAMRAPTGGGMAGAAAVASAAGRSGVEGPGLGVGQRVLFGLGYVMLPYVWGRASAAASRAEWDERMAALSAPGRAASRSSRSEQGGGAAAPWSRAALSRRTWGVLRRAEACYHVASLLNLVVFLRTGTYRSVLERAAGMRLVYQQARMTRVISFEYLNRQLVWQELSEALLFVLPLLDLVSVRRALAAYLPRLPSPADVLGAAARTVAGIGAAAGSGAAGGDDGDAGACERGGACTEDGPTKGGPKQAGGPGGPAPAADLRVLPGPCPVCASDEVLVPFAALPCAHVFCYYCLRANCEADAAFACPLDGVRVDAMRRWAGSGAGR